MVLRIKGQKDFFGKLIFSLRSRRTMRQKNAFVELFRLQVGVAERGIQALTVFFDNGDESGQRVEALEHEGDELVHRAHALVDEAFIPPYDKPDIISLVGHLDDIIDNMKSAVLARDIFRLQRRHKNSIQFAHAVQFCEVISDSIMRLRLIVDGMPNFDGERLRELTREIHALEDGGDELRKRALGILFPDPEATYTVAMEGWREVIRRLETITDACQHAADVIVSMARKEGK